MNHPKYSSTKLDFDFSLLELETELEFNDNIRAIDLPAEDFQVSDDADCEISGWGKKNAKNLNIRWLIKLILWLIIVNKLGLTQSSHESQETLRAAMIPIANQRYCNRQYRGIITSRMICAGDKDGGKDS